MKIVSRFPVGIIFRAFAQKEDQLEGQLALIQEAVNKALVLKHEGRPVFKFVDILVPSNKIFPSVDCGLMVPKLSGVWKGEPRVRIHTSEGDLFSGTLNEGVGIQMESGIIYSLIVSPNMHSYLTMENLLPMLEKADSGAKVVGMAFRDLRESIEQGRVANTFCLWHNRSLMTVGGFNLLSAEPENDKDAHYLQGLAPNGDRVFYKINGVEEVIPTALLVKLYGRCIGIVYPASEGQYEVISDPDVLKRHIAKMATKHQRQDELLSMMRLDASMLANGIIA